MRSLLGMGSCDGNGDSRDSPSHFRLDAGDFGIEYTECTSATECGFSTRTFHDADGDGWRTVGGNTQMGAGTECTLYHWNRWLVPIEGGVRIELREWADFEADADNCTLEATDALGQGADCLSYEVIEGDPDE